MAHRSDPLAWPGQSSGPASDPMLGIEWPYSHWLGNDVATYGAQIVAANDGGEMLRDAATRHDPALAAETIDWSDAFSSLTIGGYMGGFSPRPHAIIPTFKVWELARLIVPVNSLGVVEKVITAIDAVDALDENGDLLFAYGPQNGHKSTLEGLEHPDPAVQRLDWAWRVAINNMGPNSQTPPQTLNGTGPQGRELLDPWSHLGNGSDLNWADGMQRTIQAASIVRVFVLLRGAHSRWRVKAGARLVGFTQSAGQMSSAIASAMRRAQ